MGFVRNYVEGRALRHLPLPKLSNDRGGFPSKSYRACRWRLCGQRPGRADVEMGRSACSSTDEGRLKGRTMAALALHSAGRGANGYDRSTSSNDIGPEHVFHSTAPPSIIWEARSWAARLRFREWHGYFYAAATRRTSRRLALLELRSSVCACCRASRRTAEEWEMSCFRRGFFNML